MISQVIQVAATPMEHENEGEGFLLQNDLFFSFYLDKRTKADSTYLTKPTRHI